MTPTKDKIRLLVDELADKKDCVIVDNPHRRHVHEIESILIGDVLEKIMEKTGKTHNLDACHLCQRWQPLGFTKSLQQILEEGWEDVKLPLYTGDLDGTMNTASTKKQLTPPAQSLVDFLYSIFIT
jgi:hypothetical protein